MEEEALKILVESLVEYEGRWIGTPAVCPKPQGKSPGWQVGNKRTKKTRYPLVKKGKTPHKKRTKKAA